MYHHKTNSRNIPSIIGGNMNNKGGIVKLNKEELPVVGNHYPSSIFPKVEGSTSDPRSHLNDTDRILIRYLKISTEENEKFLRNFIKFGRQQDKNLLAIKKILED